MLSYDNLHIPTRTHKYASFNPLASIYASSLLQVARWQKGCR